MGSTYGELWFTSLEVQKINTFKAKKLKSSKKSNTSLNWKAPKSEEEYFSQVRPLSEKEKKKQTNKQTNKNKHNGSNVLNGIVFLFRRQILHKKPHTNCLTLAELNLKLIITFLASRLSTGIPVSSFRILDNAEHSDF